MTYSWFKDDEQIENAAASSITSDPINGAVNYMCRVTDRFGYCEYVYFAIRVPNNLQAWVKGKEGVTTDFLFVTEGEPLTLEVAVTADDMEGLTYYWIDEFHDFDTEHPDKYTGSSYMIESVGIEECYFCNVTDKYGTCKTVAFNVNPVEFDNDLRAYVLVDWGYGEYEENSTSESIPVGESRTLSFEVNSIVSDALTYSWFYRENNDEEFVELAQTDEPQYTIDYSGDHYKAGEYKGVVRDQFGNEAYVLFYVEIYNELNIYDLDDQSSYSSHREVEYGKSLTLRAAVEAIDLTGMTYRWEEHIDGSYRQIAEGNVNGSTISYEIPSVTGKMDIRCTVTDTYGNTEMQYYDISVKNSWKA